MKRFLIPLLEFADYLGSTELTIAVSRLLARWWPRMLCKGSDKADKMLTLLELGVFMPAATNTDSKIPLAAWTANDLQRIVPLLKKAPVLPDHCDNNKTCDSKSSTNTPIAKPTLYGDGSALFHLWIFDWAEPNDVVEAFAEVFKDNLGANYDEDPRAWELLRLAGENGTWDDPRYVAFREHTCLGKADSVEVLVLLFGHLRSSGVSLHNTLKDKDPLVQERFSLLFDADEDDEIEDLVIQELLFKCTGCSIVRLKGPDEDEVICDHCGDTFCGDCRAEDKILRCPGCDNWHCKTWFSDY